MVVLLKPKIILLVVINKITDQVVKKANTGKVWKYV